MVPKEASPGVQADEVAGEISPRSVENHDNPAVGTDRRPALALGFTAAIVTFVGAIVVRTTPFAVLSAPLPASVNRLGLAVDTGQALFFGRPGYLLVPATVVAAWAGYRSYRWYCRTTAATPD